MAFRGLDVEYEYTEVITPLAIAYNRQNQIVGIQCCKIVDWRPYYGNREAYSKSLSVSIIPLAYLDRYANFSREGDVLTVHGVTKLGKVYDDGTVIADCLQAFVHASNHGIECRLENRVSDGGYYYDYLLVSPSSMEGLVATAQVVYAMQKKGIRICNLDGLKLTKRSLKVDLSNADIQSQLYGGVLSAQFNLNSNGRVEIPETIFDNPVAIIPDCSYGVVNCTIEKHNNLVELGWAGGYIGGFDLCVRDCAQLRNIALPATSRGHIRIENQHNIKINIGFDPKFADTERFKCFYLTLKDCDNVVININPKCETIVSATIEGKVHIKDIPGRSLTLEARDRQARVSIDDFSDESVLCVVPRQDDSKGNVFLQSARGKGTLSCRGILREASIDIAGYLFLFWERDKVGLNNVQLISCKSVSIPSSDNGHNKVYPSNGTKTFVLSDIDYRTLTREFQFGLVAYTNMNLIFENISSQAIQDLPDTTYSTVCLDNISGEFTWKHNATMLNIYNCTCRIEGVTQSAYLHDSKAIINRTQGRVSCIRSDVTFNNAGTNTLSLLHSTVLGNPKFRRLDIKHQTQADIVAGVEMLYAFLKTNNALKSVSLHTPEEKPCPKPNILDFTPYDALYFDYPSLQIRLLQGSVEYDALICPYKCLIDYQGLGSRAKYYYLATEEQCKAMASSLIYDNDAYPRVLVLENKTLNAVLKRAVKTFTQERLAGDPHYQDSIMEQIDGSLKATKVICTGKKVTKQDFITFVQRQLKSGS